jgi:hypothetical protein
VKHPFNADVFIDLGPMYSLSIADESLPRGSAAMRLFQSLPRTIRGSKHVLSLSKGSRLKNNPHGSCGFGFLQ